MGEAIGSVVALLTLLTASCMDLRTMTVRRWVWAAGGLPVLGLMIVRALADVRTGDWRETAVSCVSLAVYWGLQQFWFARMYGRADSHAFCLCAAALWLRGYGFAVWVYQLALAFVCLAVAQALRGNIARSGNLKRPVAFLPYITASALLIHCILEQKML